MLLFLLIMCFRTRTSCIVFPFCSIIICTIWHVIYKTRLRFTDIVQNIRKIKLNYLNGLLSEGPTDRLGLQECEEPWECVGPHVPHGHDVSDHHWPHSGQRQVLHSHTGKSKDGLHLYGTFQYIHEATKWFTMALHSLVPTNFHTPWTDFFSTDC